MWLGANEDRSGEILLAQSSKGVEERRPAALPASDQLLLCERGILELAVAIAVRLLAVARQESGPARELVAGDVQDQCREAVGAGVEPCTPLVVGHLAEGSVALLLGLSKSLED